MMSLIKQITFLGLTKNTHLKRENEGGSLFREVNKKK